MFTRGYHHGYSGNPIAPTKFTELRRPCKSALRFTKSCAITVKQPAPFCVWRFGRKQLRLKSRYVPNRKSWPDDPFLETGSPKTYITLEHCGYA
jgi:hypothetical protein